MPNIRANTLAVRRHVERKAAQGYRRATIAFSPLALEVIEAAIAKYDVTSREAALNLILERISEDAYLRQEFMAVST